MRLFLLTILLTTVSLASEMGKISASGNHVCYIENESVKCEGDNNSGQLNVPTLSHPKMVAVGYSHSCALDDSGVHCWGSSHYGNTHVPNLSHPSAIAARGNNNCAIDGDDVKCWGYYLGNNENKPKLKNPRLLTVGDSHVCVIDDMGPKCWNIDNDTIRDPIRCDVQTKIPKLTNPIFIEAGDHDTCVIDEANGNANLKCWGCSGNLPVWEILDLDAVIAVSTRGSRSCALDRVKGLICWKYGAYTYTPQVKSPVAISGSCVLSDAGGVQCWSDL
jgi:alpha-tubulin suppressor-like RCC1 family protein